MLYFRVESCVIAWNCYHRTLLPQFTCAFLTQLTTDHSRPTARLPRAAVNDGSVIGRASSFGFALGSRSQYCVSPLPGWQVIAPVFMTRIAPSSNQ